MKALLLTGVPACGKTTVVERVADALSHLRIRGFLTGEIRRDGRRVGFELTTFGGEKQRLAHVDIDSRHRVGRYGVNVEGLDRIAERALVLDGATDVYIVDEIGKMECFSDKFRVAVRRLLDSGRPLIATVARRGGGFIAEVKDREDVELWEVAKKNRDDMPDRIVRRIDQALRKEGKRRGRASGGSWFR